MQVNMQHVSSSEGAQREQEKILNPTNSTAWLSLFLFFFSCQREKSKQNYKKLCDPVAVFPFILA